MGHVKRTGGKTRRSCALSEEVEGRPAFPGTLAVADTVECFETRKIVQLSKQRKRLSTGGCQNAAIKTVDLANAE